MGALSVTWSCGAPLIAAQEQPGTDVSIPVADLIHRGAAGVAAAVGDVARKRRDSVVGGGGSGRPASSAGAG